MSSESAPSELFPLRLSDFEYYMLADDRPSHPNGLSDDRPPDGTFSEQPFRESLDELLSAHPLLDCRIENVAGKGWCWVRMETPRDVLSWGNVEEQSVQTVQPEVREIDVRNGAAFTSAYWRRPITLICRCIFITPAAMALFAATGR